MNALRIGSMCTGYGGLDMAVQRVLGGELAWVADPDPGAAAILAHHHPDVPNLGDITKVRWQDVARVDILAAGFPCQSVSLAGSRAGLVADAASGLWSHVAIGIAALRPSLVVIENVGGLRSARADSDVEPCPWCLGDPDDEPHLRALGAVLGDLASLGFDAEWTSLRASDVGAAHQRERVFILAWPADAQGPRLEGARLGGRPALGDRAAADADRLGDERDRTAGQPAQRHAPRSGGAAADTARLGAGEPADEAVAVAGGGNARPELGRRGVQPAKGDGRVLDWGRYDDAVRRWERILGRPAPTPRLPTGRGGSDQLSPVFVEWLMGLPAGWVTDVPGLTRNAQLKALGNGVVPQQGAAAFSLLIDRMGGAA